MASLADQFLEDVATSSDSDDASDVSSIAVDKETETVPSGTDRLHETGVEDGVTVGGSAGVSTLLKEDVNEMLLAKLDFLNSQLSELSEGTETSEGSAHELVSECASAIAEADEAIQSVHRLLTKVYSPAFPELESLILNPLDYARVAALAVKHDDLSGVDFRPILPSAVVITVQVTASSTAGVPLTSVARARVQKLADLMQRLDGSRALLLTHLGRKAVMTAPNLCAIVGGEVAAQLLAHAGGLTLLARMPSGNVKVLGKKRETVTGASSSSVRIHNGVIHSCPLVMTLPPKLRSKGGDIVAGKATLAARVDAARGARDGNEGRKLRAAIETKFAKMQERAPARTAKPLPVPGDEAKRRHRGGARARKEKERMGMTEMRKLSNRMKFGEAEAVAGNDLENEGMGMLNTESQMVRVRAKKTDSVSVAARRRLEKQKKREGQSEAELLGITSSFVLPPGPEPDSKPGSGLKVSDGVGRGNEKPQRVGSSVSNGNSSNGNSSNYFSSAMPFLQVDKKRRKVAKE